MCGLNQMASYFGEALVLSMAMGLIVGWAIGKHDKRAQ